MTRDLFRKFDPIKAALVGHGLLLVGCLFLLGQHDDWILDIANTVVPAAILLIGLVSCTGLVVANPINTLSPVCWFYLGCAAYYGLGPLVFIFGNTATVDYIQVSSHYPVDKEGIFQVNVLTVAGITVVSLAIAMGRVLMPWESLMSNRFLHDFDSASAKLMLWNFIVIGGIAQYVFRLPYLLGLSTWILPGAIQQLSQLLSGAIIITMLLVRRGERAFVPVMWTLIVTELIAAALTYAKTSILFTLIAIGIGRYLSTASLRGFALLGGTAAALYALVLSPFILFVRGNFQMTNVFDLSTLQSSITTYANEAGGALTSSPTEVQSWWARLNYCGYQKFAIDAYNSGQPGMTLRDAAFALMPRLLFPDKPLSTPGKELSDLLNFGSSDWVQTGMGYFAEGYWNGGIVGMVLVCLWVGLVFAAMTRFVFAQMARGNIGMVFVGLIGIQWGMGVCDWFVGSYIGGLALVACYAALVMLLFSLAPKSQDETTFVASRGAPL